MREEEDRDDGFVRVKVVDPGLCRTKLTRTWPKALRLLYEIPMRTVGLLEHPRKGAERIVRAATLSKTTRKKKSGQTRSHIRILRGTNWYKDYASKQWTGSSRERTRADALAIRFRNNKCIFTKRAMNAIQLQK